jgi:uncharacterized protein with ParB-like and HNH nuclease domain
MKNLLDTKTVTINDLFGNGKIYRVPKFQRDYSWSEENWEDLWYDILELDSQENPHYMGSLVLQTTEKDDEFIIVDGQQRITTLSILAVAVKGVLQNFIDQKIDVEKNQERVAKLERTFIGEKTLSNLFYSPKLFLNANNNNFFQAHILKLKPPIVYAKLRDSEKLLYDAYKYFFEKLKIKFKNDNGEQISKLLEKIVTKKLVFIQISVDDNLSAYTVFETLNARGVELTTTDLLKNYFFSIATNELPESEIAILEEDWKTIVDTVGLKKFPVFLRYYLNAKKPLVRKERLFKEIKKDIKNGQEVFDLIRNLKKTAYLYDAIKNSKNNNFWHNFKFNNQKEIQQVLEELNLFAVSQPIPLLFSVYKKIPEHFAKILKICVVISFRYNVIAGMNPNELERVYNQVAMGIYQGNLKSPQEIFKVLQSIYINDQNFENSFATKIITTNGRNKKLVKYILTKIENQIAETDYDFNEANFIIEHVLPENYNEEWEEIFGKAIEEHVYRLGNYALLEEGKNQDCARKSFAEKREIYKISKYKLTSTNLNYDEWNALTIDRYQEKLAKYAKAVWKVYGGE